VQAEAEAKRQADEKDRVKAEAKAKRQAKKEPRVQAEAEAKRQAEEEARLKAEAKAKRQAEKEARVQAKAEAKRQAEEEARRQFEAEQKLEAELEQRAELERHNLQLEEEAARLAEQKNTESTAEMNSCSAETELKENLDAFVQEVQDEIEATGKPAEPASPAVESEAKKQIILAVDDSPTIRKLLSLTLSGEGYEVLTAADGIEALNILSECIPDLILTDINMPKLNGYKLCKFVKKHERTQAIPVVMLSGKDGVFDKMRGKMNGCDDYITKPFESAELAAKVRETLSGVASN
jgi:twitching motility two-component system response regulator PilG